jgi:hypothetical protein
MRRSYESWCEENAKTPLSARDFNRLLTERGAVQPEGPQTLDGKRARVWLNVELRQPAEQEQPGTGFS